MKLEFDPERQEGRDAIVASFDLKGFSDFCNDPDAHRVSHRFLSRLFDLLNKFLLNKMMELLVSSAIPETAVRSPDFVKFTGDGAIMIWLGSQSKPLDQVFCDTLVTVMDDLRKGIPGMVEILEQQLRYSGFPKQARVGISKGTVYPLLKKDRLPFDEEPQDWFGHCINLAVRLQDHCPEIGLIVHDALKPSFTDMLSKTALIKKGKREVPVRIFARDWSSTAIEAKEGKFV